MKRKMFLCMGNCLNNIMKIEEFSKGMKERLLNI
jgi:hypothetical protein